ncbi:MAG: hypothetical protein AB7D06_14350 [Pedobacter sp.]
MMTQDEQHLDLLAVFHYVVGGLTALFSCMFLLHIAMGIAMLCGAFDGDDAPPEFFGWLFIIIPSILALAGWTLSGFIVAAGRKLKKRTSYTLCLVVAGIECIVMPFGTVLGVFTLVVLSRESVKALFAGNQAVEPKHD